MIQHFLSVRVVPRLISIKLGSEDVQNFPVDENGYKIVMCLFMYRDIPADDDEFIGLQTCTRNRKDLVFEFTSDNIDSFNDRFNRTSAFFRHDNTYDYFGVLALAGKWKHAIGREGFNTINQKFSLGLAFPEQAVDERENTNVIAVFGTESQERFSTVKLNKKVQFRCDMRNIDVFFTSRNKGNDFRVSDVLISPLPPDRFIEIHGDSWKLLDGTFQIPQHTDIETNILRTFLNRPNVPDLRGRFVRMMDLQSGTNPDGNLEVLAPRDDKTRTSQLTISQIGNHDHTVANNGQHNHTVQDAGNHSHGCSSSGNHQHQFPISTSDGGQTVAKSGVSSRLKGDRQVTSNAGSHGHSIHNNGNHHHGMTESGNHTHQIGEAGGHNHAIDGGQNETCPKYMTFYFYMKVK